MDILKHNPSEDLNNIPIIDSDSKKKSLSRFIDFFFIVVIMEIFLNIDLYATNTISVHTLLRVSFFLFCIAIMIYISNGHSVGKRIAGIKVIRLDGKRLTFRDACGLTDNTALIYTKKK